MTILPVAFLVVKDGDVTVKYITASENQAERIVGMVPDVVDKVSDVIGKFKKDEK